MATDPPPSGEDGPPTAGSPTSTTGETAASAANGQEEPTDAAAASLAVGGPLADIQASLAALTRDPTSFLRGPDVTALQVDLSLFSPHTNLFVGVQLTTEVDGNQDAGGGGADQAGHGQGGQPESGTAATAECGGGAG